MGKHAATIVGILNTLLGSVKERGMLLLLPIMGLLLCAFPEHMPAVMEPALQRLLQLMLSEQEPSQVVAGVHFRSSPKNWHALPATLCVVVNLAVRLQMVHIMVQAITLPDQVLGEPRLKGCGCSKPCCCAAGLGVFARLLLQNTPAFLVVLARAEPALGLQAAAPGGGQPGERALLALLDLWLDRFDSIGVPHARKLSALAMCTLLTVQVPAILDRLEPIAGCITSVWFEVLSLPPSDLCKITLQKHVRG